MPIEKGMILTADETERLASLVKGRRRIFVWGEMGAGKSTLAFALARRLERSAGGCRILSLDPGTPLFGIPGAACLGRLEGESFVREDCQALCTLDAARFRLPLAMAARRSIEIVDRAGADVPLLIDPPGVTRGAGGAELLAALAEILGADAVLALCPEGEPPPLERELALLGAEVHLVLSSPKARRPSANERSAHRTDMWDRFLLQSVERTFFLDRVPVHGTPPPKEKPGAWAGRQAALLSAAGETVAMGEVVELDGERLKTRLAFFPSGSAPSCLLIRDAERNAESMLGTAPRMVKPTERQVPGEMKPHACVGNACQGPVAVQVGPAWAVLVGGVFGDPLLHVRIRRLRRSFLFDLGDPARLQARAAHQVRAVFLSHAHVDHIGGFLWLLRSRIGPFAPCRIFGPPETVDRIEHFLGAVTWDRIGDDGPVFEVCEIHGRFLRRARLQPGKKKIELPERTVRDGTILEQESHSVKAVVCDHKIPSVAYALAFSRKVGVKKDALVAAGLPPGPWLGRLKMAVAHDRHETEIRLPDGTIQAAGRLAEGLVEIRPGKKLVYAADIADTAENREKLVALARSADTMFCETAFAAAERDKAAATQHLTTLAAVEIARAAGVRRLVPFHFSKRYENDPGAIYDEIVKAAGPVEIVGMTR